MDRQTLALCFHNALSVRQTEYGLFPRRHTDRQCAYYRAIGYGAIMGEKALMTAGITLEFDTDAPAFTLRYRLTGGYPNKEGNRNTTLDVYENGVLIAQQSVHGPWNEEQQVQFTLLRAGEKRVAVWLPHTLMCEIADVELPAGAYLAPLPQRARKILFLGDSITQGIGAEYASMGYAMQAARQLDCEGLNQSIAALKFEAESLDSEGFMPDIISVAYGTNDWSGRPDRAAYDREARAFFARLNELYPAVPVAVLTPVKRCRGEGDRPAMYKESELFAAVQAACAPYKQMRAFPGWALMPHTPGFFQDGLHPNDLGNTVYADSVIAILRGMLG